MAKERFRPSAEDIFERVKSDAGEELARPVPALAFSGLFAGATVGFSGLAAAAAAAALAGTSGVALVAAIFYPVGFIAAILGRAQLFTENTLYPVTLVLDERRHLAATLRLWGIVFAANLVGALLFALLAVHSGALSASTLHELTQEGLDLSGGGFAQNFWSGVIAGWLLALVAWLIEAADQVSGQIALVWLLTFVIGIAGFDHCVSTTSEVLSSVFDGNLSAGRFFGWFAAVTLGNVAGGVLIVAVVNYGQVRAGEA